MLWIVRIVIVASILNPTGVGGQIVNTTTGLLQGTTLTARNGREFSAFMGIPYGKSPEGNLRFQVL